jgi:ketosteroid isomerase-like protein
MSQENVAMVGLMYDAFLAGDLAAMLAGLDPAIGWRSIEDTENRHGHEGVAQSIVAWLSMWEQHELEAEEYIDAGEQVVVTTRLRGRGRLSGAVVEDRYFAVWTLRDRRAIAYREYTSKSDALKAVGLSE